MQVCLNSPEVMILSLRGIADGQKMVFDFDKLPVKRGFKMEGYW